MNKLTKLFSGILLAIMLSPTTQATELEPIGLNFYQAEAEKLTWQESTIVDYEAGILELESGTYTLPPEIMPENLAQELLKSGNKIEFITENNKIVKLNLVDSGITEKETQNQEIGLVLAIFMLLAILGVWRRFYRRATK